MSNAWHILGFDYDAVVGANQDWRLARELVAALRAAGEPLTEVFEAAGNEQHIVMWYVADRIATILDEQGVSWRRFWIGSSERLPTTVHRPLKPA